MHILIKYFFYLRVFEMTYIKKHLNRIVNKFSNRALFDVNSDLPKKFNNNINVYKNIAEGDSHKSIRNSRICIR